jgi:hypothetical protein
MAGACASPDPGIVKNDCPGTPKIVSLDQVAPFWDGLERVHFTVPGGTPNQIQLETFNPAVGTWTGFPTTNLEQADDDSYVASASITPTEDTKGASFKLRVRALLDNCPASDWATTDGLTVGDPLTDTVWKGHVDAGDFSAFFQPSVVGAGTGTTTGPYSLVAGGVDHTMQFHASGVIDEIWGFGVTSAHAGDAYAGCKFQIHYTGQWRWSFTPFFRLVITGLAPAPTPLAGSTCTSPPIADLAINQPGFVSNLQPGQVFFNVDYSALTHTPVGQVTWQDNQQINLLSQSSLSLGLSDVVGVDMFSVQASIFVNNVFYVKQ